jgi:hypothetical protein
MMNIDKFVQLRNFMTTVPEEQVYMSDYLRCDRGYETVGEAREFKCGTAGCIAGWEALRVSDPDLEVRGNRIGGRFSEEIAEQSLGITHEEARILFQGEWSAKHLVDITKAEVLDQLDRIIATGTIERVHLEDDNDCDCHLCSYDDNDD